MKLYKTLADMRRERGLSQQEVAEALDVSRQAISKWEQGTATPTTENLIQLSRLYGVTVEGLCGAEQTPKAQAARTGDGIFIPKQWLLRLCALLGAVALLVGNFVFSHRTVLFAQEGREAVALVSVLHEKYGQRDFEPLDMTRRIFPLSPAADRLEWVCTDGEQEFLVYGRNGAYTDSYGVQVVEARLLETVRTCAQRAGVSQYLEKIQWRQEGLYASDSDFSAFYHIDPDTPLSQLDRIHFIKLKEIPDRETGVSIIQALMAQLEQEGIVLSGVSISFQTEQVYYHITTDTNSAMNLTAEQVSGYTAN